jgi:5'-phosphate synthase pdxT subunit
VRIGVLALQGDFAEHGQALARLGVEAVEVRLPADLQGADGLIIPGGESTTIGLLAERYGLAAAIKAFAGSGRAVWGTCAGMILLAAEALDGAAGQPLLGLMDVTVRRNAFGRQRESFETELTVPAVSEAPIPVVFIRAPLVERVGPGVEVLARMADNRVVAVRQGNILATAFHPELTRESAFHRFFVALASGGGRESVAAPGRERPLDLIA